MSLVVHEFGGAGPHLMICHATGFHAECYRPMLAVLTQSFTVWGVDFRAHGGSTVPVPDGSGDPFDWSNIAQDLLRAVDHVGGGPIAAIGHSMGGAAILMAELECPGTFRAAWVFEPIVFPRDGAPQVSPLAEGARRRRQVFDSRDAALARYASRPPLGQFRADALFWYVHAGFEDRANGTVKLACTGENEAATFNGAGMDVSTIAAITMPVMVAHGQTDLVMSTPASFAPDIAANLANGSIVAYDDLTHFGPFEMPDRIAHDATRFLTSPR